MEDMSPYIAEALNRLNRLKTLSDKSNLWDNSMGHLMCSSRYRHIICQTQMAKATLLYSWYQELSSRIHRFFNRTQKANETVFEYASALRTLQRKCHFRCKRYNRLFVVFRNGVRNQKARDMIKELQIEETSERAYEDLFDRAFEIALEIELKEMQ
ncbi:hypothetical protein M0804_014955 [Polistes exclamans]|nr:hypothetical protein M0804_014955 [Polistes exclamans]